jgi:WD40 repeat protein
LQCSAFVLSHQKHITFSAHHLSFSFDGCYLLATDWADGLMVWNVDPGVEDDKWVTSCQLPVELAGRHEGMFRPTTDYQFLVTCVHRLCLWSFESKSEVCRAEMPVEMISAQFTFNGNRILVLSIGMISVYSLGLDALKIVESMSIGPRMCRSPVEDIVATASFDTVHIWDIKSGTVKLHFVPVSTAGDEPAEIAGSVFQPDGEAIAIYFSGGCKITICNARTGTPMFAFAVEDNIIHAVYAPWNPPYTEGVIFLFVRTASDILIVNAHNGLIHFEIPSRALTSTLALSNLSAVLLM